MNVISYIKERTNIANNEIKMIIKVSRSGHERFIKLTNQLQEAESSWQGNINSHLASQEMPHIL